MTDRFNKSVNDNDPKIMTLADCTPEGRPMNICREHTMNPDLTNCIVCQLLWGKSNG